MFKKCDFFRIFIFFELVKISIFFVISPWFLCFILIFFVIYCCFPIFSSLPFFYLLFFFLLFWFFGWFFVDWCVDLTCGFLILGLFVLLSCELIQITFLEWPQSLFVLFCCSHSCCMFSFVPSCSKSIFSYLIIPLKVFGIFLK